MFEMVFKFAKFGCRLFTRGADNGGNVANFVETEQIVEYGTIKCSFVQVRFRCIRATHCSGNSSKFPCFSEFLEYFQIFIHFPYDFRKAGEFTSIATVRTPIIIST